MNKPPPHASPQTLRCGHSLASNFNSLDVQWNTSEVPWQKCYTWKNWSFWFWFLANLHDFFFLTKNQFLSSKLSSKGSVNQKRYSILVINSKSGCFMVHSRKLTYFPKNCGWETILSFWNGPIFRGYVGFREATPSHHTAKTSRWPIFGSSWCGHRSNRRRSCSASILVDR